MSASFLKVVASAIVDKYIGKLSLLAKDLCVDDECARGECSTNQRNVSIRERPRAVYHLYGNLPTLHNRRLSCERFILM